MENKRDSFIFYRSFYEAIKDLPAEDKANILDAICELSLNFEELELSGISKSLFILIKPQLEANIKRYENGKKPKHKKEESKPEAKPKQTESKTVTNVNVNDNVNPNVNENKNIPTVDDIKKYTIEKGYEVDANKIWHYYNDNNWCDAKGNQVKNWKTKILNNWCKEENKVKPKYSGAQRFKVKYRSDTRPHIHTEEQIKAHEIKMLTTAYQTNEYND